MTNTMRVDICYRPLRIGWAVHKNDLPSIKKAITLSHVLWGGKFNPIIIIENEKEAELVVENFRVDFIHPLSDSEEMNKFIGKFPHLKSPLYGKEIFQNGKWGSFTNILDIYNALSYWHTKTEWSNFKEKGVIKYEWQPDDPLASTFLIQLGAYPSTDEIGVNYVEIIKEHTEVTTREIDIQESIPSDIFDSPPLSSIGTFGLAPHHSVSREKISPGFYIGSAKDTTDIVNYWNLRARDIPLLFIDPDHIDRYTEILPKAIKTLQGMIEHRHHEHDRRLGIWTRNEVREVIFLEEVEYVIYVLDDQYGSAYEEAPFMYFDESSTLGVLGESNSVPRVNFSLNNKPFDCDNFFHRQHLIASISLIGALYGDEQNTYEIPYIPELNEFYSRTMHFEPHKIRVEPNRIGLVINATTHDSFLNAMPVTDLFQKIFSLAKLDGKVSNSGRIVRQLITQLGGLQGSRAFKIPGARELLKKFGPRDSFTRETAHTTISDRTADNRSTFSDHTELYLTPRPPGVKLTPPEVFTYMVERGLFRIGVDLECPKCAMSSWIALDVLKQQNTCELCGNSYDAIRQLIELKWKFRRSGLMGAERNAQGAIPVALTLQQLDTTLLDGIYSPSLDLYPTAHSNLARCEVDLVWLNIARYPKRSELIIAECKDQGPIRPQDFQRDVDNMRLVADALPNNRIDTYILFVKLSGFTPEEVEMTRTLNDEHKKRVILLTARELEPYFILERTEKEYKIEQYATSASELARITDQIYFQKPQDNDGQ